MIDPHEIRLGAGQAVMGAIDDLDEELIELLPPLVEAANEVIGKLRERGRTPLQITQFIVGMALGATLRDIA